MSLREEWLSYYRPKRRAPLHPKYSLRHAYHRNIKGCPKHRARNSAPCRGFSLSQSCAGLPGHPRRLSGPASGGSAHHGWPPGGQLSEPPAPGREPPAGGGACGKDCEEKRIDYTKICQKLNLGRKIE